MLSTAYTLPSASTAMYGPDVRRGHAQELAVRAEHLDVVASVVDDVEVAGAVDVDVDRDRELAGAGPERAERPDELPIRGELLDPGVARVRDIEAAVRAERDVAIAVAVADEPEFTVPVPRSLRAPRFHVLPIRIDDPEGIVERRRRPDPALRIDLRGPDPRPAASGPCAVHSGVNDGSGLPVPMRARLRPGEGRGSGDGDGAASRAAEPDSPAPRPRGRGGAAPTSRRTRAGERPAMSQPLPP